MINQMAVVSRIILYKLMLSPFLRVILGVKFRSKEKLNFEQPTIIVANHNSHLDAMSILCNIPIKNYDKVHPVVARDYFYKNALLKNLSKFFLNSVAISRDKQFSNPLANCEMLLQKGHSLILFPEGSRGEAEKLQDFKHGVSKLLKKYPNVNYLPVYCTGLGEIMPKGDWVLIPKNSSIQFGERHQIDIDHEIPVITKQIKESVISLMP